MSKMGKGATVVVEGVFYYNALTNFLNLGTSLSFQPFKSFGYARPRGRNKPRETGWSGRTYIGNGYNTGNPLIPSTFERQDVTRNVFGRDYYINVQNGSINDTQIYPYDALFSYVNGTTPSNATVTLSSLDFGLAQEVRRIRVSGCADNNINGIYRENTPGVYSKSGFLNTIEVVGDYWTLISNSVVQYTADNIYTNPWDVGFWDPNVASGTLLVEDDIREFTWQPLVDFVNNTIGITPTFCNIFATMSFDQYCILSTRYPSSVGGDIPSRPITQREPFANLAWPAQFRVYYQTVLPPRT